MDIANSLHIRTKEVIYQAMPRMQKRESKFFKLGILLSPAAGAVLMTASTVVVAINASLLKVKN
jgi:hypothetical protein